MTETDWLDALAMFVSHAVCEGMIGASHFVQERDDPLGGCCTKRLAWGYQMRLCANMRGQCQSIVSCRCEGRITIRGGGIMQ